MLLKNTSSSSKTGVELYQGISKTILAGQVFSCDDDKAKALINQDKDFVRVDTTNEFTDSLVITKEVSIPTAEILALNATPKQLISAPGAGYAIKVKEVVGSIDYKAAAYITNTSLEIRYDNVTAGDAAGGEVTVASIDALLTATADKIQFINGLGATEGTLVENKGVSAKVATGDPLTGDSDIKLVIRYTIESV